jgi:AAA family ATP:ADP antiporter
VSGTEGRQDGQTAAETAGWIRRAGQVEPGEAGSLVWSFAYFFCLLCSYYILRPLRDEMGIQSGVDQLQWLFTGTFLATLLCVPAFGALVARVPRRRFLPAVYWFFIANLLLFFTAFDSGLDNVAVARGFYIWTSVFNLFVVSVFWSFMADIYSPERARRLFGIIAAGGTAGAIAGPALTASLATRVDPVSLLLVSAGFLTAAVLCIHRLAAAARHWAPGDAIRPGGSAEAALGGSMLEGFRLLAGSRYLQGICLLILLYSTTSTFLYFEQAHIVSEHFQDSGERTRVFAAIDLAVNALTLGAQFFLTARLARRLGLGRTLALVPALLAMGFLALAALPVLAVFIPIQVLRRAGNYAVMKPAREMLFTVLDPQQKYKAKNLIDTVVYRGGDALAGWAFAGLTQLGLGLGAIALLAAPLCLAWAGVGRWLGRQADALSSDER